MQRTLANVPRVSSLHPGNCWNSFSRRPHPLHISYFIICSYSVMCHHIACAAEEIALNKAHVYELKLLIGSPTFSVQKLKSEGRCFQNSQFSFLNVWIKYQDVFEHTQGIFLAICNGTLYWHFVSQSPCPQNDEIRKFILRIWYTIMQQWVQPLCHWSFYGGRVFWAAQVLSATCFRS